MEGSQHHMAHGTYGLWTGRAKQQPLKGTRACTDFSKCPLKPPVRGGLLLDMIYEQEEWLWAGKAGGTFMYGQCLPASPQKSIPPAAQRQPGLSKPCLELGAALDHGY